MLSLSATHVIAPLALFIAILPLQVRLATCPAWKVADTTTVWRHDGNFIVAHPVAIASSGRRLVALAGHMVGGFFEEANNTFGGVVFNANGRRAEEISKPVGEFAFANPKTVVDSRGRVHAVWAETVSETTGDGSAQHVDLWHARLDGLTWGPAERILTAGIFEWTETTASNVAIDASDRVHIVFGAGPDGGIIHVASSASGWNTDTLRTSRAVWDPVISISGRHADIAFVGPVALARDLNLRSVWATSLDLDRREFEPPVIVKLAEQYAATLPSLVRATDGALYVFWGESERDAFFFQQIGGAVRAKGAKRWTLLPTRSVFPHVGIDVRGTAVDPCGSVHLLVTMFEDVYTTRLFVATLRDLTWRPLREIPIGMTFNGRAQWVAPPDGVPRVIVSSTPWTRAWNTPDAPLLWRLFTMR